MSLKILKKFVGLRAKTYNYSIIDGIEDKKNKKLNQKVSHKKKT